jgi:hypothetical protein
MGEDHERAWKRFRGHGALWHKTTASNLEGIIRDGQITPNGGQFGWMHGQSKISWATHLGGISLLDFDSSSEEYIEEHDGKYSLGAYRMPAAVFIKLRRGRLDCSRLLLPAELSQGVDPRLRALPQNIRSMHMRVPAIEAIHIGLVSTEAFAGLVLAGGTDDGKRLWEEFDVSAVSTLKATADAAKRAARHAQGDFRLDEILEEARRRTLARKRRFPHDG